MMTEIVALSMSILGHLGPPDISSLTHTEFPVRPLGDVIGANNFRVDAIIVKLLQRLFGMLWGDADESRAASAALRYLNSRSYFTALKQQQQVASALEDSPVLAEIVSFYSKALPPPPHDSLLSNPAKHLHLHFQGTPALSTSTKPHVLNAPSTSSSTSRAWSRDTWDTTGKTYNNWISELSFQLLQECFLLPRDDHSDQLANDEWHDATSGTTKKHPLKGKKSYNDLFLTSMTAMCLLRYDVAEALFPLIVRGVITGNALNTTIIDRLSRRITEFILNPKCKLKQAVTLGCNVLNFLLRQDIKEFCVESMKKSPRPISRVAVEPSKTNEVGHVLHVT